jgi:hypothetical protein
VNAETAPSDTVLSLGITRDTPGVAPAEAPSTPAAAETWTLRLLGRSDSPTWPGEGQRLAIALGLSALFGVALGLRQGGVAIALAAVGAPAGILAVAALAAPAFAIVLALANAPVDAMDLAQATSRAAAKAGLILAGVAPGAALFVVTCEDAITVTMVGFGALTLAGAIAAHAFARELRPLLAAAPALTRRVMSLAMPLFLLFAAVLAARVWWIALPALKEAL